MQKKIFIFICCCFFVSLVLHKNVVSGQITVSGGTSFAGSHIHIGKKISSDVSEIIDQKIQQEISKCRSVCWL
jgi:hypothetical protein